MDGKWPEGPPFRPLNLTCSMQESAAPHPGRRPDSQPNLFSIWSGVQDREAAGEAGARRASLTPEQIEKTLQNGSAAQANPEEQPLKKG